MKKQVAKMKKVTTTRLVAKSQGSRKNIRPEVMESVRRSLKVNAAVWKELAKY